MNENEMSPLEKVLRLIAAAAPQPWFPRRYAEQTRFPLDVLLYYLEHLWLDGLLRRGETTAEGTGLLLSPAGEEVLRDPEMLRRLRDGDPLRPNDRGCVVRSVFRRPRRASLTRLLLWLNILWFGWGVYLAHKVNAGRAFLSTFEQPNPLAARAQMTVLHDTGAVSPDDVIHGQWWRLLANCFVHIGLIHLACNMYGVWVIGRGAEQMWGRLRYLVIYLVSGFCGSCVALAYGPGVVRGDPAQFVPSLLAGASGALCGILGAELVWLLLNGRCLPRRVVRRWWLGMAINLALLAGFSAMANVSALAHFGGVAAGGAAALVLNVQRFGPARWRWLTLLPLVALPWGGYVLVQRQRAVAEIWQQAEDWAFRKDFGKEFHQRIDVADATYEQARTPPAGATAEERLVPVRRSLRLYEAIVADLARDDFRSPSVIKRRDAKLAEITPFVTDLKEEEERLRPFAEREANRKEADDGKRDRAAERARNESEAFDRDFRQRITATTAEGEKVLAQQEMPDRRDPAAVVAARKKLAGLADDLTKAKFQSDQVDNRRRVGLNYVVAVEHLLATEDAAKRKELTATWANQRSAWLDQMER